MTNERLPAFKFPSASSTVCLIFSTYRPSAESCAIRCVYRLWVANAALILLMLNVEPSEICGAEFSRTCAMNEFISAVVLKRLVCLPRTPPLKSYSGRMSSAFAIFVFLTFTSSRLPRTNYPRPAVSLGVIDNDQALLFCFADHYVPLFLFRVSRVLNIVRQRVPKHGCSPIEVESVFSNVLPILHRVGVLVRIKVQLTAL